MLRSHCVVLDFHFMPDAPQVCTQHVIPEKSPNNVIKSTLYIIYIYIPYIYIYRYTLYIYTHYIYTLYSIIYICKGTGSKEYVQLSEDGGYAARWSRSCSGASFTEAIEAIRSRPFEATGSWGDLWIYC